MPNIDLTGQVPVEINHAYTITLTNLSVHVSNPMNVKKGAFGVIGKSKGIPDVTATFKLAVPKTGLEIDIRTLDNFTLTYHDTPVTKYMILGCDVSSIALSVEQGTGDAMYDVSVTGTEEIPG